ncbi:MAG: hypothetical protein ACYTX0_51840, partial [Nostoc sp.]
NNYMSQAIKESIVSENNLSHRSTKFSKIAKLKSLSKCSFNFWQKSLLRSIAQTKKAKICQLTSE